MTESLKDDVAIVTGAARSIGRTLALGLAAAGARVVVADLDTAGADATVALIRAAGGTAVAIGVDISSSASCAALAQSALQAFGAVSILVNNAGVMYAGTFGADDYMVKWRKTFAVNVEGPVNLVLALLPQLRQTRGRIVNVCSTSAYLASPGGTMYGTSKAALVHMTRGLAVELGRDGIRVNAIAPGAVQSDGGMTGDALLERVYLPRTPTGRITCAEDLVGPVLFLASAASGQVSGTVLPVEGGFMAMGVRFD